MFFRISGKIVCIEQTSRILRRKVSSREGGMTEEVRFGGWWGKSGGRCLKVLKVLEKIIERA